MAYVLLKLAAAVSGKDKMTGDSDGLGVGSTWDGSEISLVLVNEAVDCGGLLHYLSPLVVVYPCVRRTRIIYFSVYSIYSF